MLEGKIGKGPFWGGLVWWINSVMGEGADVSCERPLAYSHLSNKRDVTLTDFEKFHPTQNKNPPYMFIDFLDFSTLHFTFIRFMY